MSLGKSNIKYKEFHVTLASCIHSAGIFKSSNIKRSFSTFWWSADKQQWRHKRLRTAFSRLAILDEKNRHVILHYDRWLYYLTLTKHRRKQMHKVPKSNNHLQAPSVRVQWVYLLLRYDVKTHFTSQSLFLGESGLFAENATENQVLSKLNVLVKVLHM